MRFPILLIAGSSLLALQSNSAFSAPKKSAANFGGESDAKSGDRTFYFSLPFVAERPQLRPHIELNLGNEAGLAIEGAMIAESEELSESETIESGNSLKVKGVQASLLLSRYSEPTQLGGFFWTLGAGYRQYTADWKKKPSNQEREPEMRLDSVDSDGYLHHRVEGRGATGHFRAGYRYVAAQWPIAIGGHVGLRHMVSTIRDVEMTEDEEKEMNLDYTPVTDRERKSIRNRMMTTPDFALDFGMIF